MSEKRWVEKRPGFHAYCDSDSISIVYGDVRAVNVNYQDPCKYNAFLHLPAPRGRNLGTFDTLSDAKQAVETACAEQMV